MYKMYLGINSGEEGFNLPVLPEKIELNENGNNKTYDVINLGEINIINLPKLTEISFESFFPKNRGPYVSSEQLFEPSFYLSKIREWREKKQKIRFIFVGSPLEVNDLFTIENFKCREEGGEVGDIYYSIELKRYRSYAAKKVTIVQSQATKTDSNVVVIKNTTTPRAVTTETPKAHTVTEGDTLWYISKKYLRDGNRYMEIAKLNNIKNPDTISNGQVLKIPGGDIG
ncbi:LysM peptidoglycan-binding domain-containing protein [Clostridium sp. OS1-26]|uniref:LysM peptidoglycan-binding domain-containing protein n=1 Tax=Clostridium sp. OS1-26 TaxID=3070681 RepID=UPI0027E18C72|nr:LysM peptidoglycan-binding domain-containing protein [Clostridium sp. OS1-26]WML37697.1 LysM peptidoglycan-binding domain-containing protein [Clostridium sp. OS1-26]